MKLENFFEKFELFADAPDAVAKMRELVLELAVRGKLVVQNVTDEPASQLLKRVLAEKNRRTGRSERSDEEQVSLPDDEAFEIPANWEWIRATTPAVMVSDQGKKIQTKDILEAGKYPVIDQGKMFIRGYCDDSERVINVAEPIVLFGDHTRETKFIDFDFVVGADGVKLLQPICIDPRFYFLVLRWLPLESRGYARHFKLLKAARIPLPPLAEQKRIVAKVDELMALCDRLEAQQQERETRHAALARASLARFADAPTPANLHFLFHPSYSITPADLRKSILTLAVQGKLVPQDPNDEPAEELLDRVKAARESLVVERRVRQSDEVEYSLQDEADDAPPGWAGVHINDVAIVQGGKRLPKGAVFSESPTPYVYIRVTDMKSGTISETGLRYISPKVQREIARYIINKEDLYITIAGTIGDVGCVPESLDGNNLTENAAKIVFRGFDKRFFQVALTSEFVQAQFLEKTKQMAQPKLALKRIAGAKFHLPPLAEQRRIVAKVEQLMALVDELEAQLAASRTTGTSLMEAVVAELTAQA